MPTKTYNKLIPFILNSPQLNKIFPRAAVSKKVPLCMSSLTQEGTTDGQTVVEVNSQTNLLYGRQSAKVIQVLFTKKIQWEWQKTFWS